MIIPDINLLLYAYNSACEQYEVACDWWQHTLMAEEAVGLPYEVVFGFLRIATNPRLGAAAVSWHEAQQVTDSWLDCGLCELIPPKPGHYAMVMQLMKLAGARGVLISDANLAAYALSYRATLCTNDVDFARFSGVAWRNPLLKP